MVNGLLTTSIKVNVPSSAESKLRIGDLIMKKTKTTRGIMDWLFGHGWDSAGSNG